MQVPTGPAGSRRYPRAPIVEAVLEMRLAIRPETSLELLGTVGASESDYTVTGVVNEIRGQFDVGAGSLTTETRQTQAGFSWQTRDGVRHFQVRRDLFMYLQRAPYRDWGSFISEAERLWLRYKSVAGPAQVKRVGARFINLINIPRESVELKDYFRAFAEVPAELPQVLAAYLVQMQVPEIRPGIACTIITTGLPPEVPETTSAILDIDVWCEPDLDSSTSTFDQDLSHWLSELRRAKNDVFEACITDATRRLFL